MLWRLPKLEVPFAVQLSVFLCVSGIACVEESLVLMMDQGTVIKLVNCDGDGQQASLTLQLKGGVVGDNVEVVDVVET